jgi:hypothetical protein
MTDEEKRKFIRHVMEYAQREKRAFIRHVMMGNTQPDEAKPLENDAQWNEAFEYLESLAPQGPGDKLISYRVRYSITYRYAQGPWNLLRYVDGGQPEALAALKAARAGYNQPGSTARHLLRSDLVTFRLVRHIESLTEVGEE